MSGRIKAFRKAVGALTYDETIEIGGIMRNLWTDEFDAKRAADWASILNSTREIAQDRENWTPYI